MKVEPPPEELGHEPSSGFTVTIDCDDTRELQLIIRRYLPQWLELFEAKNRKYAGLEGNELGAAGKFVDVYRKVKVLKSRIWDGHEELGESNEEVIMDMIGHLFLMLYDLE